MRKKQKPKVGIYIYIYIPFHQHNENAQKDRICCSPLLLRELIWSSQLVAYKLHQSLEETHLLVGKEHLDYPET
jgi:hypothetical protein